LNEWINTSNYVYNKTVEEIYKNNHPVNFNNLRDKLVTAKTKKNNEEYIAISQNIQSLREEKKELMKQLSKNQQVSILIQSKVEQIAEENKKLKTVAKNLSYEKNEGIHVWELKTPKEVRAGAVNDVCKAIKTGIANLKANNIRHFRLGFRKKTESHKSVVVPKNFVKNKNGVIQLAPDFFQDDCKFKMGKKTIKKHKQLEIKNDCRIVYQRNEFWLVVPIPYNMKEKTKPINYCGIDPGVRTFMTSFGNEGCLEYKHNDLLLKKIDARIKSLKKTGGIRKSKITKWEARKENLINELHWKTINHVVKNNDFIFYGNIKSHDIVKNGKNRTLNTDTNNLKFYKFKERLLFKSVEHNKKVYPVNEQYTTQTCSYCGDYHKVGSLMVYVCRQCRRKSGRDVNAAKNILMKGIQENIKCC